MIKHPEFKKLTKNVSHLIKIIRELEHMLKTVYAQSFENVKYIRKLENKILTLENKISQLENGDNNNHRGDS